MIFLNNFLFFKDFPGILKKYTKMITSMISFENYYLNLWKNTIEEAKNGLKAFLILKKPELNTFGVNFDPR